MASRLLNRITNPHQLQRLSMDELELLADEIRQQIVEVVSTNGGHLASNLGIADLTVAMHVAFDFSRDRLLWDVGHQCYPHKLLTGRGDRFDTLRKAGGISGFPAPSESDYDLFATGHAGTAISTAIGLALGDQRRGEGSRKVVAVVGDASIVNGLSMEALNHAAMLDRQLLIILNDNSMAIDRTTGAMARALDRLRLTETYSDLKHRTEYLLQHVPLGEEIFDALKHLRAGVRSALHGGRALEALGFQYFGPFDGHDLRGLIPLLKRLSRLEHPVLLHVHTEKGRGCEYAVEDPCRFHSPSAHSIEGGKVVFHAKHRPTWTQVFAEALTRAAGEDDRIVAITAAMPDGTGLATFRETFPERTIDVGIGESHAVAMAAGMAKAGLRPVVAIYSTFMQRAMDQVFEEAALQTLPVVLCMDRAGLVGSDGAVHHGSMDIAQMRAMPGMTLMAPADEAEMAAALTLALTLDGPSAIRYPRDEAPEPLTDECPPFELGRARPVRDGDDGLLLAYGVMVEPALAAAEIMAREEGLNVAVVNARFAKPLDTALIRQWIATGKPVVIVEDHAITGGFGSAVLE
ncbi:MAG TPA: 1-deoxy-D-xylulose-5-phosphate synthase, partial [Phycisphaerae bacterium]|nr:1-deoxy-D-xylulose-5-phosphate synthase [Phycisphaerae bacterium]